MSSSDQSQGQFRVASLATRHPTRFELSPDAEARAALAQELGLSGLRKLSFRGEIAPSGKRGWTLTADLGATVVQPCVVTLEPVTTRIDTKVLRRFDPNPTPVQAGSELEMPEDDSVEPLGDVISVDSVMIEALSLALPSYPRAADADLGEANFAEPGIAPMSDEDAKPFAALQSLRDKFDKQ